MDFLKETTKQHPIAPLETISYARLKKKDPSEVTKLLEVCIKEGFFYLDLTEGQGPTTLAQAEDIFAFMEDWFCQPLNDKMRDYQSTYTDGYKPTGFFAGVHENSRDCYESLKVSHRTINKDSSALPRGMVDRSGLFKAYLDSTNGIAKDIITSLSTALGLEEGARFEDFHANSENSNSTLVLLRYPPTEDPSQAGHNKHTDIGSITVLFTDQWGLQVKRIEKIESEWEFIEPRAGSAIINVGDSLRFLSGKRLRSCLHRIVPIEGQTKSRHTIAYFLRPSNDTKFVDSKDRMITASEWHDQKYEVFKSTHDDQRKDTILTGGIETVPVA